jgi:membrane fusion protein (multidrug efflux system)
VQLGQRVAPGAPLMAIVPLDQVWVDANFKEPQIAAIRVGQPVTLKADLYGSKVRYHGTVAGFGAGTGSASRCCRPRTRRATGSRSSSACPVRIALDPRELTEHPLQIGLSMQVSIDVHQREGARLPQVPAGKVSYTTDVYDTSTPMRRAESRPSSPPTIAAQA